MHPRGRRGQHRSGALAMHAAAASVARGGAHRDVRRAVMRRRSWVAVLAALASLAAATLHAQGGRGSDSAHVHGRARGDSTGASARDTTPPLLPAVDVSVLRTPFTVTRAPYAVMARGPDELPHDAPGLALDRVLGGIPGLQVDNRFNYALGERVAIRGFGARSQFGVRGVRVIVDGIPATLPDGQTNLTNVDPDFVGRVEVIRGPASSLYGNAAGGVIQLTSPPPPAQPVFEQLRSEGGSHGLRRWESRTAGMVDRGRLSYQAGLSRLDYGGFRDFSAARNDHANVRLHWEPERSDLQLVGNWVQYDAENPGSLSDSLLRADRTQAFQNNRVQRTGERGHQLQGGLRWRRELALGTVELSGWALGRSIENPIPASVIDLRRRAGGVRAIFAHDAPIASLPVRWSVGAEGSWQRDDRQNHDNDAGTRAALTLDQRERVAGLAAFAQADVAATTRLTVLAGARVDRTRFAADDHLVTADNPDDSGERRMAAVSPSLGVSYDAGAGATIYANVATSFETPTTTELANRPDGAGGFNPELQPQRTTSAEVGLKGTVARTGVTYQLGVYRARVRDALTPFEVPDAPARQFFRNAGSAIHRGVELSAAAWLATTVRAEVSYALTDARFDRFTTDAGSFGGRRVPGVAPHQASVAVAYGRPSTDRAYAVATARYQSAIPVNDANSAHSPAYTVIGLRAGMRAGRAGGATLVPFAGIDNLFGVRYNTSVVVNAFGGRYFEPGPGRTLYLGLRLEGPAP